ncbi:hypothetical protein [Streptomyces sp. NBC_01205]|uniref:hypothetical protein n=1 Tax=Streptomyces sp. NBC_01205 TaxID=2903771 RepID=UPI002E1026B1|nr:hypothetical protein OG573_27460 [Streptomyces sp. NBC_01205]
MRPKSDDHLPLLRTTATGWKAHWLLEIHLIDEHAGFGASHKGAPRSGVMPAAVGSRV